ncbi:sulfite exporter TauE/SafE family protein [Methylobacter sp. S3L5C]|uniref:urease accessory protein UreH domain-containing protein n=1 Tax=Methylobacter sp. S3L5C TaxID=2839024 RepID=UPI001FADE595|nr:sulfite exporter TauE/SafE family protein [Methylobacter sp. S3L5C]
MTQRTLSFPVSGMHCAGCEAVICSAVKELPGIDTVSADHIAKKVQVSFDDVLTSPSAILACIESKGYNYGVQVEKFLWGPRLQQLAVFLVLLVLVGGVAFWGKSLMPGLMKQFDARLGYGVIFTVGFLTGFHCIGMCGGFVMNYTQGLQERGRRAVFFAHLSYALGKNLSYALLGAGFGALGAVLTITPHMRGIAALVAGIFLVLFGLTMLKLLPKFRLPSLRSKSGSVTQQIYRDLKPRRNPFSIGFLSGFLLGCGPLQAMYIMALGIANPLEGALLLLCFGTGTLIPLLTFGIFASALSAKIQNQLMAVSGILVILMGLMMTDRGLKLTQSGYNFSTVVERFSVPHP